MPEGLTSALTFQLPRVSRSQLSHPFNQRPPRLALFQAKEAMDHELGFPSHLYWTLPCTLMQDIQTTVNLYIVPVGMGRKSI